ncbi:MAG: tetratricopeptide repeat protein, partial [Chitinophagaceae bacterium]
MKKYFLLTSFFLLSFFSWSQQNLTYSYGDQRFELAKEYFQKGQYNLAYPLLKELQQSVKETGKVNNALIVQEVEYYTTVSALKQNETRAEYDAKQFIDITKNNSRVQMMNFHLAEYYFKKQQFSDAVALYEAANIANLSNREIADMKFHQGYSYFTMQQFALAKPLLNAIRQVKDDPNYIDANYYYGFIAFRDRNYAQALESF